MSHKGSTLEWLDKQHSGNYQATYSSRSSLVVHRLFFAGAHNPLYFGKVPVVPEGIQSELFPKQPFIWAGALLSTK